MIYNKKARRELNIAVDGGTLPFYSEPTYLGIKLNRSFTYCQDIESLSKKLTASCWTFEMISGFQVGLNAC